MKKQLSVKKVRTDIQETSEKLRLMPISFLKFNKILIEKYVEFYILPLKSRHLFTFAIISA